VRVASSALIAVVACGIGIARADTADEAFQHGRDLLKAGNYAEACAAFERSQQLDPSLGTQFNIAQCDEKIGKLATALELYRDLAQRDTNARRKAASASLAAKLEPRVPRLQLQIEPKPPGLVVTINGTPCTAACDPRASRPVDFGRYAIVATAPGYQKRTTEVAVAAEAKVIVVPIQLERAAAGTVGGTAPDVAPPVVATTRESAAAPARSHRHKALGFTLVGAGVAGIGGGVVFGLLARSKWNEARDVCGGTQSCPDASSAARANELSSVARRRGNLSTAMFVGGGLLAATGVVLWFTGREHHLQLGAQVAAGPVLVARGRF